MVMDERYRLYGINKAQVIITSLSALLATAAVMYITGRYPRDIGRIMTAFFGLFVLVVIIGWSTGRIRAGLRADDLGVTFSEPFSRPVTVWYEDIREIAVYNQRRHIHRRRGMNSTFYVETIIITTPERDYTFKTIMDIKPNSLMEASGMMDRMLEMGKFSVLKKFIEEKTMY